MKRIMFLALAFMFAVSATSWALPDNVQPTVLTSSASVKAGPGVVYDVIISWSGATAGDTVNIKNSTTSTGTNYIPFTVPAASGTLVYNPPVGTYFSTGIYCVITSSGSFTVSVKYF